MIDTTDDTMSENPFHASIRTALELMRFPKMNFATESSRFRLTPVIPYRMMVLLRRSIVIIPVSQIDSSACLPAGSVLRMA